MQVHYQYTRFGSYLIKQRTRYFARTVFTLSALCLLIETSAVCPPGRMPPDCQSECTLGHFGNDCNFLCPTTCMDSDCQPDSGICYRCQLGFTGPNCSRTCHRGFFGQDCNNTCSTGCFRKQCDPFTGLCEKCVPGYEGPRCETHYLLRNHTNLTSSSLSSVDMLNKKQQHSKTFIIIIYISAAAFICIMFLCSVCLCSYLVTLKGGQTSFNQFPIYKRNSLNVSPSSFLRRPGATETHEYIEMETVDADCDTTDVKPDIAVNSLPDRSTLCAGTCPDSTARNYRKHLFNLPKTIARRVDRNLSVLEKDPEGVKINQDDINTPELSNILKINAPLRVEQAANFSRDLYFKSYLPSQRFISGTDDLRDNVADQQDMNRFLLSGSQLAALSLVHEKKTEVDTVDTDVIDESRKRVVESSTSRWSGSRPNGPFVIDESDMVPKDACQKSHVMFNLAGDLLQNREHHTQPGPLPDGNCPRGADIRDIQRNYHETVFNTDSAGLPEKNDDHASPPAVTDGHRSRVYAETTEPLLKSSRLLWRARKSLTSVIRSALKPWTGDIYEPVSEYQRRAVEKLELTNSEITKIQPEEHNSDVLEQSEFPCNCLDCELQTEERKFDLEFTCHSVKSQTKERYKDVAVLGVAASADNSNGDTIYQQENDCAAVHCNDSDDTRINQYNIGTSSGHADYKDTVSNIECRTDADVINGRNYSPLPHKYVKRLISGPVYDVHNQTTDDAKGNYSCGVSQDNGMSALLATNRNHLSCKPSLVDDVTNNLGFCSISKKPCSKEHNMSDQAWRNDTPVASVSCSDLSSQLPNECTGHHIHNSYVESYSQQSSRSSEEMCAIDTATSNRRPPSCNREKDNVSDIVSPRISLQNTTSPNYFAEEMTANVDTFLMDAFPKTGVILLRTFQTNIKQTYQTNTHIENVDKIKIPEITDSFISEIKRNTNVARTYEHGDVTEASQENYISESGIRNNCDTPIQSSQNVDENPQGSNFGSNLAEQVSLIPKSIISLTVRKQPNKEIKPVYTGDIDLQLSRCTSRDLPQPEEKQRQEEL